MLRTVTASNHKSQITNRESGLGGEERFIDPILARCRPRFPEARGFALEHRVLLVEAAHGIPLDIALGGLPYEARVVE